MIIEIIQITIAVLIILLILLQERSAGISGLFGGGDQGGGYQTRRGLERVIFWATIVLLIAFTALAIAQIVL